MLSKAQLAFATTGKQLDGSEPSAEYGRMLIRQIRRELVAAAQQIDALRIHPVFQQQVEDLFPIDRLTSELNWEKWHHETEKVPRKVKEPEALPPPPVSDSEVDFGAFGKSD